MIATIEIEKLGAKGDGIATIEGKPVYVPFVLPGEIVRIEIGQRRGEGLAANLIAIESPSPERVTPPCRHFGVCGGCAGQHMENHFYRRWKTRLIEEALQRRGLNDIPMAPLVITPSQARRRASFTAHKTRDGVTLGFHARASHRLIDLQECPVMLPAIERLLSPLRSLLQTTIFSATQIVVNATDSGLDVAIQARQPLDLKRRQLLADFTAAQDLARVSWDGEPVATRRTPLLRLGALTVEVPPAAFLQASVEGETAMREAIAQWTSRAKSLADLYGGIGTLSLPFVPERRVHLVEGDAAAVAAAMKSAKQPVARSRLTVEQRDLARQPLAPDALNKFDAVLFDPPRAGAAEQAEQLARSDVSVVIAVSCDPATFARDARRLVDGGYRLEQIVPIDQFLWSSHIELVAHFTKKPL
ncbi:MAG: TRAM domain-containing protein [Rhodospirillales bacterium]